jgi:hypothetical protein
LSVFLILPFDGVNNEEQNGPGNQHKAIDDKNRAKLAWPTFPTPHIQKPGQKK